MGQPLAKRIIGNNIFFANALDHPNGSASCKENNREQHFFANTLDLPASYDKQNKRAGQLIIWMGRPVSKSVRWGRDNDWERI